MLHGVESQSRMTSGSGINPTFCTCDQDVKMEDPNKTNSSPTSKRCWTHLVGVSYSSRHGPHKKDDIDYSTFLCETYFQLSSIILLIPCSRMKDLSNNIHFGIHSFTQSEFPTHEAPLLKQIVQIGMRNFHHCGIPPQLHLLWFGRIVKIL